MVPVNNQTSIITQTPGRHVAAELRVENKVAGGQQAADMWQAATSGKRAASCKRQMAR